MGLWPVCKPSCPFSPEAFSCPWVPMRHGWGLWPGVQTQLPSSGHVSHERVLCGRGAACELREHAEEPNSMLKLRGLLSSLPHADAARMISRSSTTSGKAPLPLAVAFACRWCETSNGRQRTARGQTQSGAPSRQN